MAPFADVTNPLDVVKTRLMLGDDGGGEDNGSAKSAQSWFVGSFVSSSAVWA